MGLLESFRFLPNSLNKLSESLQESNFQTLKHYIQPNLLPYSKRKGICPYSYIDSYEKFEEHCLPEFGNSWKNTLTGKLVVTEADVDLANQIWEKLNCMKIADYHDIYLQSNVLLLTDVFESFRNLFTTNYDLDPCQYFSAPNIS